MSFFLRQSIRAARPVSIAVPARRTFANSSVRALKESNKDTPETAAEYEKHKQDQLTKQKEGKNHWQAELASNSEEAIVSPSSMTSPSYQPLRRIRKIKSPKDIPSTRPRFVKEKIKRVFVKESTLIDENASDKHSLEDSRLNATREKERVGAENKITSMTEEGSGRIDEPENLEMLKKSRSTREPVAADRHEHSDHSPEGIKELQKKTERHAEEKHSSGTSQNSGL